MLRLGAILAGGAFADKDKIISLESEALPEELTGSKTDDERHKGDLVWAVGSRF